MLRSASSSGDSGAEIAGISASLSSIGSQQGIENKEMVGRDFIDPQSYWIDSTGCIGRMGKEGGKQTVIAVILRATEDCSDAEWEWIYQAVRDGLALKKSQSCKALGSASSSRSRKI
jgi:hypothetical protein